MVSHRVHAYSSGWSVNGGNMGQIEELKMFVSERLHAAASEILGAIEKTMTDYEKQASRLKEENNRHRSVLDIILKAKLPGTQGHATKSTTTAISPPAPDSSPTCKARETPCHSSELQCVFTSRTDLLKSATNGDCPYCLKSTEATETHLIRKHYLFAVHFTENGTVKFVVPCTCKDRIQGRSHWHCPYCRKIIYRKCNFERHISKQHRYTILQQSHDAGDGSAPSVSAFEEEVPLSPEPWCQELGSVDQEDPQTSLLLQIKEEQEEIWRQASPPELQNSGQLQTKGEQIQKSNSEMGEQSMEEDHAEDSAFTVVCVDNYIQDLSEINSVERSKKRRLSNSSTLETWEPQHATEDEIEEWKKNHTPCSSLQAPSSKRKKRVKRSSPTFNTNIRKSTKLTVSQNPTGPHCCKACGKTFHYMYTLKAHVQTHTVDKICGICGEHLESTGSLIQHLQSHTERNKCDICGKQFSNNSRLKQHRRFHGLKGLNVTSSV
ncbi:zinc finger and SCAN domain-containing protein 5C isoform X2 [Dicentrarchus labrax]|uniref:zinc finger and SCAN domain-containing protein 5C isoform X2 n=1 Tax=Dicentrarchus labrax TaxID=13489 RepID=UPI0021F5DCD9|nr:zinc finger and SCAN domain-containing protein 5C isoform X2 [Dicentrarchus labrax]